MRIGTPLYWPIGFTITIFESISLWGYELHWNRAVFDLGRVSAGIWIWKDKEARQVAKKYEIKKSQSQ